MKHNFRGWTTVFSFTFRQATKGIAFKLVTTLVTLIIIGVFILVNVLTAKPEDKNKTEISPIKSVFVLDQSGLAPTDFQVMNPKLSEERFKDVAFVNITD